MTSEPVLDIHPTKSARVLALYRVARAHGVEIDIGALPHRQGDPPATAGALAEWAREAGLWAQAVKLRWRHLMQLHEAGPVILLLTDGNAALLVRSDRQQNAVLLEDPRQPVNGSSVLVDELRLAAIWAGETVLVRPERGRASADAPFSLGWLADLVLQERHALRDVVLASAALSVLTVFPPLVVMSVVNRVLEFRSIPTLILLSTMIVVVILYDTILAHARRLIIAVVGARLDAKLNLHVFSRLLRLPVDYYEKHPAGETIHRTLQINRLREFITGKLLSTMLDLITLCVLLPVLFFLNATLAWLVLLCGLLILLTIIAFLPPMRTRFKKVVSAETSKSAALAETILGIKTMKALALEPQRRDLWDDCVADAGKARLDFAFMANWPQTIVYPLERVMVLGTILIGAYLAIQEPGASVAGALFAFMMLSQRVAAPLIGLAKLIEDVEEVGAAIGEVASVINQPLENHAAAGGLAPTLKGEIVFEDVSFTYQGTKRPALERASFAVPAGSTLGIVGRSGSGKSTIARLLQGINPAYTGAIRLDGSDMREINLRHLRRSLGVVLQDNFLFRGSVRENIIAGRPGLTLNDAVVAARLAGAEEFIERLPRGYETYIEEGSPNLSGGQKQRLAIARALIHNPQILILDEATSALDPESEAIVNDNLARIGHGRTMLIVSHRLSSLVDCDQILMLEQGRVADIGPHADLVERCAPYRQLWAQQNRHLASKARHVADASGLSVG